jgi:UDP-N-acetylglucosamine 3-dehydrogenase
VKVALVGTGYWGSIVRKYISSSDFFELVGIYNSKNIGDLFLNHSVEAVFVCTPADTHFEICKKSLENGKHVFCEKIIVKKMSEFDKLVGLSQRNDKELYTDYTYIYSPSIRFIQKNLKKKIGDINYIISEISQFGRFYKNENAYEIVGVHILAVLWFMYGT